MSEQLQAENMKVAKSRKSEDLQKKLAQSEEELFLTVAKERFKGAVDHESLTRKDMLEDFKFSIGDQWPAAYKGDRNADGRPCLTMDHIQQAIKMVTNELREGRPSLQINPVGDGATREVADVLQGICRHIELLSDAEVHYDIAGDHMVRIGCGYLRVYSEYAPGDSFDQEIKITSIRNPLLVYDDPSAIEPDKSDARYKFIIEDVPWTQYKKEHPRSKGAMASLSDFVSVGDQPSSWASKETIRLVEYFHVEEDYYEIIQMGAGQIMRKDRLSPEQKSFLTGEEPSRRVVKKRVVWTLMNALEKLDERTLPGTIIPVIPMLGDDLDVDGKRYVAGLVRNAKDAQRMYNYQASSATEQVALAPRAPFVGAKGQFKSSEAQWRQLNTRNFPYLEYDQVGTGDKMAPPPARNVAEPPIQATVLLMKAAGDDLKASMGIYDASLGQPGPEQSGKAILARQKQGDKATLNFSDNQRRTIRSVGRVILEWAPVIYDTPRIMRIMSPDSSIKNVGTFNSQEGEYSPEDARAALAKLKPAVTEIFDIGVGRYDVAVATGPGYQAKRQEAQASIMALVQAFPDLMKVAGDLLVGNMDWPYAQEISKRLKKMIPPDLLDDKPGSPEDKVQQLQAQLKQLGQQHDLLAKALTQATELIKDKKLELASKERIALWQTQAQMVAAELKARSEGAIETLKAEMAATQSRLDMLHDHMTLEKEAELQIQAEQAGVETEGAEQGA